MGAVPPRGRGPLVVVTDDHYPPYLFRGEDGKLQGILKDRWALWSQRNAIPVEVRGTDWASAQREVRDGSADVIETLAYTPRARRSMPSRRAATRSRRASSSIAA